MLGEVDFLVVTLLTFLKKNIDGVFIKSSRQGSSVGCSIVKKENEVDQALKLAFKHDTLALIEPYLENVRELEVSVFEYLDEVHVTKPGEITTPTNNFYSFDEKYSSTSHSHTHILAELPDKQIELIKQYARKAFIALELKDLSRIDFFLTENGDVFLNEINTFPGLTPISMFPKMMENYGVKFSDFLKKETVMGYQKMIAHCNEGEKVALKRAYEKPKNVLILIGPEGDFSNEEVELANENGFQAIGLGKERLRTETAGIVACHTVNLLNG